MHKRVTMFVGIVMLSLLFLGCASASLSFDGGVPALSLDLAGTVTVHEAFSHIPEGDPWSLSGDLFSERVGEVFSLTLPPGGEGLAVWGTDVYTGDSNVGTAAVHSNLISFQEGGTVYFKILEGRTYYQGSTRNGVESLRYGSWPLSFMFTDKRGTLLHEEAWSDHTIDWNTNADFLNLAVGEVVTLRLPPGGSEHTIWGSGPYSSDSPIGTAAVHAGLITFQEGGVVTIEFLEEAPSFDQSTQNGVTSEEFDGYLEAYRFL
ncbi:MAG: LCCL domain-containing protein [Sphaerochaeta sp.]